MEMGLYYSLDYSVPETLRYAKDLGCRWSYLPFDWLKVQPSEETFVFDEYDRAVREAQTLGINLIGGVSSDCRFPDGNFIWRNSQGMMPDPSLWQQYVTRIVDRYCNTIHYWEVWSEPNCRHCNLMSYYNAELYGRVLALTTKIIRNVDHAAQVILGGLWLNSLSPHYVNTLFQTGATDYFDIFNFHLYTMPPNRESIPFPLWKNPLGQWIGFFRDKLPNGCPIWMTEFGISTRTPQHETLYTRTRGEIIGMTEEEQADWFTKFAETADTEWNLGVVIWYQLRDKDDPSRYYASTHGLLRPDGSPKPIRDRILHYQAKERAVPSAEKEEASW